MIDYYCRILCLQSDYFVNSHAKGCFAFIGTTADKTNSHCDHLWHSTSTADPEWELNKRYQSNPLPVSMALLSFFFHCSATSFARGSSGLGALNNAWIDSNTVRICRAGDHLSGGGERAEKEKKMQKEFKGQIQVVKTDSDSRRQSRTALTFTLRLQDNEKQVWLQ